jgi:pimeloyl-ACP methyl ester carboxylesterase
MAAIGDDFRLTALDLPGHGDSHPQALDEWSINGLAEVVAEAVEALNEPEVALVGHSMGGAVALEAARKLKDRVCGVILVDTFVIPYGDLTEEQAQQTSQPFYDDFPAAIEGLVDNFTASTASEQDKTRMKAEMAAANPDKMLPLWSDLLRWNPEAAFADVDAPIHAINGDLISDAARTRCSAHVTEHLLDGAGHFPQIEMPERFHRCLGEVLKKVS